MFSTVICECSQWARGFAPGRPFRLCLMFVRQGLKGAPLFSLLCPLAVHTNCTPGWKSLPGTNTGFLWTCVKKFYKIEPRCQSCNTFFLLHCCKRGQGCLSLTSLLMLPKEGNIYLPQYLNVGLMYVSRARAYLGRAPNSVLLRHDRMSRKPTNLKRDISIPVLPVPLLMSW